MAEQTEAAVNPATPVAEQTGVDAVNPATPMAEQTEVAAVDPAILHVACEKASWEQWMILEQAGMSANDIDSYQAEPANVQKVIESAAAAVRQCPSTPDALHDEVMQGFAEQRAEDALHDEVMQGFAEQRAEDMLGITEQDFVAALNGPAQKLVVEDFPNELATLDDPAQ
jgi:hypothetical protein